MYDAEAVEAARRKPAAAAAVGGAGGFAALVAAAARHKGPTDAELLVELRRLQVMEDPQQMHGL